MSRPHKERELDQAMWEEVNFALVDADVALEELAQRPERVQSALRILRDHVQSTRKAVVDWGAQKGFSHTMRPELELMAKGGLQRAIEARRRRLADQERVTPREAEAV